MGVIGYYEQNEELTQMKFSYFECQSDGTVTGKGKDEVGKFVISGTHKGPDVTFTKQYIGQHALKYTGKKDQAGAISGKWEL